MFDVGLYWASFSIGGYNHDDIAGLDTGKGWIGAFHTEAHRRVRGHRRGRLRRRSGLDHAPIHGLDRQLERQRRVGSDGAAAHDRLRTDRLPELPTLEPLQRRSESTSRSNELC